jgi:integrase
LGQRYGRRSFALVKDIFLFCCYTGLAYADIYKLKRTEIVEGIDGGKWITTKRQKTDTPSRIPILPMAMEIMEKYEDHPQCENENRVLPVLSNQKMNSYLKEIADLWDKEEYHFSPGSAYFRYYCDFDKWGAD